MRVKVHSHSEPELVDTEPRRLRPSLVYRPHDVVAGGFDEASVAKADPKDLLEPVRLDGDDAGHSCCVVDLATDLLFLHELTDRHHALGCRDEGMPRLTRRALRLRLEADVEPDRGVEGRVLVDEDRLQLGLEGVGLVVSCEVASFTAPAADGVDDAADHLLHGALALGGGHAPPEVLLRDDVRRGLGPELRELDTLLLERGPVLARDVRVAELPLDLVERVTARDREEAARGDARLRVDDRVHDLALCRRLRHLRLLRGCHRFLPSRVRQYVFPPRRANFVIRADSGW